MVLLFAIMSYMDTGHEFSPKMQTSPADKAAPICRSLLYREDAKQNFNLAAQMAIANGKAQLPIDAEKFGRYSMIAMRDTVKDKIGKIDL